MGLFGQRWNKGQEAATGDRPFGSSWQWAASKCGRHLLQPIADCLITSIHQVDAADSVDRARKANPTSTLARPPDMPS